MRQRRKEVSLGIRCSDQAGSGQAAAAGETGNRARSDHACSPTGHVTRWLQLRFDFNSTAVFDCLSKVIKVTVM